MARKLYATPLLLEDRNMQETLRTIPRDIATSEGNAASCPPRPLTSVCLGDVLGLVNASLGNPEAQNKIFRRPDSDYALVSFHGHLFSTFISHKDRALRVQTFNGVKQIGFEEFIRGASLSGQLIEAPSEEAPPPRKRKARDRAIKRTLGWLDKSLVAREKILEKGQAPPAGILGVCVGGVDEEARKLSAEETSRRAVAGFVVGDVYLGETSEERVQAIRATISKLPPGLPRAISGVPTLEEMVEVVAEGIDVLRSPYALALSQCGYACTVDEGGARLEPPPGVDAARACGAFTDGTKINLRDAYFRDDFSPLLPGCTCVTCKNHTRAYIHHLLNMHEMSARVLLYAHNRHRCLLRLGSVRESLT